jgi:hypothetical protein
MNSIDTPNAVYLIRIESGATVLCEPHTRAFEHTMLAANVPFEVYAIDPDEEPCACQACHLREVSRPQIILPH